MTDQDTCKSLIGDSMRLRLNGPIVVGLVVIGFMLNPLTIQANQVPRMRVNSIEPTRALYSRTDADLDRLAPVASAEAAPAACPQQARLHCPPIGRRRDGKLVEFDPPGTTKVVSAACGGFCGAFAYGINGAGTVVGSYTDKYVVPHGFVRFRNGRYCSFDAPGAGLGHSLNDGTVPYAIDAAGVIAGQYEDSNSIYHGFVREPNGSFSTFSVPAAGTTPGSGQGTIAWDLNGYGDTAGFYIDDKNVEHGFVRSRDRHITTFDPPGSVLTSVCQITCLSDVGAVGTYDDKQSIAHGFWREPNGRITLIDAPGAGRAAHQGTVIESVNAQGTITGALVDSNFIVHGYVRYRNGSYLIGEARGAGKGADQGTYPFSINAFDAITGFFVNSNYVLHGFERFKNGALAEFDAPDASTTTEFRGTRPSQNNFAGEVSGYFTDSTGLNHGFLFQP